MSNKSNSAYFLIKYFILGEKEGVIWDSWKNKAELEVIFLHLHLSLKFSL